MDSGTFAEKSGSVLQSLQGGEGTEDDADSRPANRVQVCHEIADMSDLIDAVL